MRSIKHLPEWMGPHSRRQYLHVSNIFRNVCFEIQNTLKFPFFLINAYHSASFSNFQQFYQEMITVMESNFLNTVYVFLTWYWASDFHYWNLNVYCLDRYQVWINPDEMVSMTSHCSIRNPIVSCCTVNICSYFQGWRNEEAILFQPKDHKEKCLHVQTSWVSWSLYSSQVQ
jgi:hypothetical protein